jgi:hypothetical protein
MLTLHDEARHHHGNDVYLCQGSMEDWAVQPSAARKRAEAAAHDSDVEPDTRRVGADIVGSVEIGAS